MRHRLRFSATRPDLAKLDRPLEQPHAEHPAHDAKARFGQLLDTARREPVGIERHGRAVAVLLSKEAHDELNGIKLHQLRQLRAAINVARADLERGAYAEHEPDELPKLSERIKAAGRERLAKKGSIGSLSVRRRISPRSGSTPPSNGA